MRIIVKDKDTNLNLPIPTRLVVNGLTAGLLCRELEKYGTHVTRRQLMAAGDIFRKYAGQLRFNLGVGHVTGALAVELTGCIRGDMGR